jgi:hypothetical protein
MAELLDILDAFTMPLKIGWVAWLAWGIGLVFWYRHERKSQTTSPRSAPMRRPFVSKPSMPQRTGTRLITPEPAIAHDAPMEAPPIAAPPPVAPALLESAPAPLDEPDHRADQVAELDRFVADFEMNTRHRRSAPVNGEPSSFDGHTHSA